MGKNRFFDIEALREYGVTPCMIAEEMGVCRQELNSWFTGARNPSFNSLKRLCNVLSKLTGKKFIVAEVNQIIKAERERRVGKQ